MENNNDGFQYENKEQEIKENVDNNKESTDTSVNNVYQSNMNQDNLNQNNLNAMNQGDIKTDNAYQNNAYQNNAYQNSTYQNNAYQNNTYQNAGGYQGYPYQNGVYQNPGQMYQNTVPVKAKKVKTNNGGLKRVLSYVLVGIVCATLGGAASTAAAVYILPRTKAFVNTPLYKAVASNSSAYTNSSGTITALPAVAASGGLTAAQIVSKVAPAVVEVQVKSTVKGSNSYEWPFGSQSQDQVQEGVGSGIIFSKDGYILTNYHVVTEDSSQIADSITVVFSNGKTAPAKVVNFDSTEDIAVIKVTTNMDMPGVAEFGDSGRLQVGDSVIAIGNPLGNDLVGTVTSGIISAVNRKVTIENKTLTLIQTDAAINAGNSGGPLVNSLGQVIGVNSAKINETGVEGIGFAIPINTIKPELEGLQQSGLKIGIGAEDVTEAEAKQYNIPVGVLIDTVDKLSPADKAGIQRNDVIVEFDGQKVTTLSEINKIKFKHKTGDTVKVIVCRNGKNVTLNLTFTAS